MMKMGVLGGVANVNPIKFLVVLITLSTQFQTSEAILPSGAIDVTITKQSPSGLQHETLTFLASQASFGSYPHMRPENNEPMTPMLPPDDDPLLCNEAKGVTSYQKTPQTRQRQLQQSNTVMIAPRGQCSFERKALSAQRLGASALIVYGTPSSRYSFNQTKATESGNDFGGIDFPKEFYDYDCKNGEAMIPMDKLSFNPPPYNNYVNDPVLTGGVQDGNLCAAHAANTMDFTKTCPSSICLLNGTVVNNNGVNMMKACCAWDVHIWLYSDSDIPQEIEPVTIPAFYVTMSESKSIFDILRTSGVEGTTVVLTLYARYAPEYNPSSVLIWALGVFVAGLAAYLSASDYREGRSLLKRRNSHNDEEYETIEGGDITPSSNTMGVRNRSSSPPQRSSLCGDDAGREENYQNNRHEQEQELVHVNGYQRVEGILGTQRQAEEEQIELNGYHAIGFIFMSAGGLLVLFFLKIYSFVKFMYAFGCSNAMIEIMFIPFYTRVFRKLNVADRVAFTTNTCEIGTVTLIGLISALTAYTLGIIWTVMAFTIHHPNNIPFFWIMQDVMGACVCITFLSTIKLNSLKVASMLLIAAFFYDIFFVFVTPYLTKGGKSIMVDVATSGGPPTADPTWCEKYPDDADCLGGDPLPMLLTIPRIMDFAGGSSLLGLGDIVLPGLLLSFAARFDEAKKLAPTATDGTRMGGVGRGTYFLPVVVAYAVGLAMANAAVFLMKMGQPALLYLVPCCLGTMVYLGRKRGELDELWETPRVIRTCDELLYGSSEGSHENDHHSQSHADERGDIAEGEGNVLT